MLERLQLIYQKLLTQSAMVYHSKLRAYGCKDSANRLIQSYLSDRFQRVRSNWIFSEWLPVHCGVPQASLLGPLFNIFVNDVNWLAFSRSVSMPTIQRNLPLLNLQCCSRIHSKSRYYETDAVIHR